MTTSIRTDLAQHIRRVDGGNRLTPDELAAFITDYLTDAAYTVDEFAVMDVVRAVNPDKRMGAGALADAIVDEFHLDEEN